MPDFTLRPITDADRDWVARFAAEHWGSDLIVSHGDLYYISHLPGFMAEAGGVPVGLITYIIKDEQCEVGSLDSLREGLGIGTALIDTVKSVSRQAGCKRLFLITTNDNVDALRFYQRRGFVLAALRKGAINESRKIKPEIPLVGNYGIPIRDELELEIILREA